MLKASLLISLLFAAALAQEQPDKSFCDIDAITPDPDNFPIPSGDEFMQFQADIEKNIGNSKLTEESREFYDGKNNVGITRKTVAGKRIGLYSYYKTDELLYVDESTCVTLKLSEMYSATDFLVTTINGTEHIVSGLTFLLKNLGLKFVYIGAKNKFRGIPVKEWQTCLYDKNSNSTLRITVSFSDDRVWFPATSDLKSIPIQYRIDYKNKYTNAEYSVVNSITRFLPKLTLEEEYYATPDGVFCPDRKNSKPLPALAKSFRYWVQIVDPRVESDLKGTLRTRRIEMDFNKRLSRSDYYLQGSRIIELHDYNTGLKYEINRMTQSCSVTGLNMADEPHDPSEMFDFVGSPEFQYVGMKRTRGINTDVWIAPRKSYGLIRNCEWYFSTSEWSIQEQNEAKQNEPVMFVVYTDENIPAEPNSTSLFNTKKVPSYFHITNFDQTRVDLYDFDISSCEAHGDKKHLRFSITANQAEYLAMFLNQLTVRDALVASVQAIANVSLIRVSQLDTIYDNNGTVYVSFSLFDKPRFYGLPNVPAENSLNDAYTNLKNAIDNKTFSFSLNVTSNITIQIFADQSSLNDLENKATRYNYISKDSGKTIGYTGGSVVGFVLGFLVIGLVTGFIVGYVFIVRRAGPIALPGPLSFFNPNFKSEPSSSS